MIVVIADRSSAICYPSVLSVDMSGRLLFRFTVALTRHSPLQLHHSAKHSLPLPRRLYNARRLSFRKFFCLLATLRRNYWTTEQIFEQNFTTDISVVDEELIKFVNSSASGSEDTITSCMLLLLLLLLLLMMMIMMISGQTPAYSADDINLVIVAAVFSFSSRQRHVSVT